MYVQHLLCIIATPFPLVKYNWAYASRFAFAAPLPHLLDMCSKFVVSLGLSAVQIYPCTLNLSVLDVAHVKKDARLSPS